MRKYFEGRSERWCNYQGKWEFYILQRGTCPIGTGLDHKGFVECIRPLIGRVSKGGKGGFWRPLPSFSLTDTPDSLPPSRWDWPYGTLLNPRVRFDAIRNVAYRPQTPTPKLNKKDRGTGLPQTQST